MEVVFLLLCLVVAEVGVVCGCKRDVCVGVCQYYEQEMREGSLTQMVGDTFPTYFPFGNRLVILCVRNVCNHDVKTDPWSSDAEDEKLGSRARNLEVGFFDGGGSILWAPRALCVYPESNVSSRSALTFPVRAL